MHLTEDKCVIYLVGLTCKFSRRYSTVDRDLCSLTYTSNVSIVAYRLTVIILLRLYAGTTAIDITRDDTVSHINGRCTRNLTEQLIVFVGSHTYATAEDVTTSGCTIHHNAGVTDNLTSP